MLTYEELRGLVLSSGASVFGTCTVEDLRPYFGHLSLEETESLSWGISVGIKLSERVLKGIIDHPSRHYLHHYKTINYLLDQIALKITLAIQSMGHDALPIPASQIVDWERQTGHLSHKMIALRAGIGWIGRNNLMVHPEYGAKIRLVTVLTSLPLKENSRVKEDCGTCRRCIEICPAGALKDTYMDYDKTACIQQLKYFSKIYSIGQYICGLCVKVCSAGR